MRKIAPALVLALIVAACGADVGGGASSTTEAPAGTTTSTGPAPTTTQPEATTTVAPTTTTVPSTTPTNVPGTPIDFGPRAGDILMVIGVRHDDSLNLRAAPGTSQPVLATIPGTETRLRAAGETRQLDTAFWTKVEYQGKTGWVHMRFVGYAGGVEDGTAEVVAELGGYPEASSLAALGQRVASVYTSDEVQSRVVQVTAGSAGDLHEIVFDVIGFADDSVGGARLHIFAERTATGFRLKTVEVMAICIRGVDDGVCV